jgi:hypothetical protein
VISASGRAIDWLKDRLQLFRALRGSGKQGICVLVEVLSPFQPIENGGRVPTVPLAVEVRPDPASPLRSQVALLRRAMS